MATLGHVDRVSPAIRPLWEGGARLRAGTLRFLGRVLIALALLVSASDRGEAHAVGCRSTLDCSLAGEGVSSRCQCDPGVKGEQCAALALSGVTSRTIHGLPVSLPGPPHENQTLRLETVWGGHAIRASEEEPKGWYWIGSALEGSLSTWTSGSTAALGARVGGEGGATTPFGPFVLTQDLVAPGPAAPSWFAGSVHGVYVVENTGPRWSNGSDAWLLFFTGMPREDPLGGRKIGVAYSPNITGPWRVLAEPILEANQNRTAIDTSSVSNPTPAFLGDGSGAVLLAYKGLGLHDASDPKRPCTDGSGHACIFLAQADHWSGPYRHTTANT